jgi:hypothetical protein
MREPRGKVRVSAIASPRSRSLRSLSSPPITPTLRAHLRPDNGSAGFPHADYKGPPAGAQKAPVGVYECSCWPEFSLKKEIPQQ